MVDQNHHLALFLDHHRSYLHHLKNHEAMVSFQEQIEFSGVCPTWYQNTSVYFRDKIKHTRLTILDGIIKFSYYYKYTLEAETYHCMLISSPYIMTGPITSFFICNHRITISAALLKKTSVTWGSRLSIALPPRWLDHFEHRFPAVLWVVHPPDAKEK